METDKQHIENIYEKEISLFSDLLNCIKQEKDNLINLDIDKLWAIMEEKQEIIKSIQKIRTQYENILNKKHSETALSMGKNRSLNRRYQILTEIKEEIKTRISENISFVKDTLGFFNGIIQMVTSPGKPEEYYGPKRIFQRESSNRLYQNEV